MLGMLGLAKKGHLRPTELSGGEKQRVAIGRALVKEPNFCFADEPTSALDWHHGEEVIEMLRNAAHERNATVLVVAHDARIIPYADRVLNLDDGMLREPEEDPSATDLARHQSGTNGGVGQHYPRSVH
jgi:putative ABC transport system ATP-binding protein